MLTEEEFKNLAKLARLDAEDESLRGMREDFNKTLEYVEKIKELDTDSAAGYYTAIDTRNVMREDIPGEALGTEEIAQIAPEWDADHFVVPGVIESM